MGSPQRARHSTPAQEKFSSIFMRDEYKSAAFLLGDAQKKRSDPQAAPFLKAFRRD
jgi:hypothetical protein